MTSYATVQDNGNATNTTLTSPLSSPTLETAASHHDLTGNNCMKKIDQQPCSPYCDVDSFSESEREKMDSTPENIKKIDDVINETVNLQPINKLSALSHRTEQIAVNNSITKFCLAKPLSQSQSIDSREAIDSCKHDNNNTDNIENQETLNAPVIDDISSEKEVAAHASNDDESASISSNGITTLMSSTKQSCAFTIDNFNDKECDTAAQAAKYKSMMERFQNRHRRGASLSKLDSDDASTRSQQNSARLTTSQSSMPFTVRSSARNSLVIEENNTNSLESETTSVNQKVKLRVRDRSTSRVRDASKRHSWSPRSSTHESNLPQLQQTTQIAGKSNSRKTSKTNKQTPGTVPKGAANLVANRTHFAPRSTAMQLALRQVDFMCPQPPLTDFKHLNTDADDVSEAGTYTLDGDNYTEEQKDLMNIDKNAKSSEGNAQNSVSSSKRLQPNVKSKRSTNVLEVNYYHDSGVIDEHAKPRYNTTSDLIMGNHQTAGAYLQKIKSRVLRNINATKSMENKGETKTKKKLSPTADEEEDTDVGCFTSVTTSGVLAKQRTLDARPKIFRNCGLSTSQIDSSEYISNETKSKSSGTTTSLAGGFTDHQKAEYRLNVFTNQKELSQKKFAATRNLIKTPPETPADVVPLSKFSEVAVLQTAQTKHDWIQEWARNARARSLANDRLCGTSKQVSQDVLMTRSYTCADTGNDSLTDDSVYSTHGRQYINPTKLNRCLAERFHLPGGSGIECDYASDPSLPTSYTKPPKSPTKIPSPLHSLGRTRSVSRTRVPLHNMTSQEEDYLQQTVTAINTLQETISRKNSLKSPTPSASPRAHSARSHIIYSPEETGTECSPQHSLPSQRQRQASTASLMTSSINEQQLQMLTSGEYLLRQMCLRKNSFDANVEGVGDGSPRMRIQQKMAAQLQSPTTPTANEGQCFSSLRRSSSFTARVAASHKTGRPNFQNLYTPPAARHGYGMSTGHVSQGPRQTTEHLIKKSASSNNFGQAYSDYDDNLQYYINDEDDMEDLGEDYFSSGGEENIESEYCEQSAAEENVPENNVPLTNTRYNKALLMRIERSKQKVTGKPHPAPVVKSTLLIGGGVVACPNTPELPRRTVKSASARSSTSRQSVPRDTSLSRLAQQVPNSLASAKKQLLQTAANVPLATPTTSRSSSSQRAQPRYLDISKYKPAQSNQFLRKNDAKSTLKQPSNDVMKRSPSSSSMGLARTDPSRSSNRSVRSATSAMAMNATTMSAGRASSAVRRDISASKQKEVEMAMWKRRSKYDPMKAAAEDKRKREEAKRLAAQTQQLGVIAMPTERPSRSPYRRNQL
uniref:Uncharacterized protein n=1 Tax=Glossina brevipalpis TaxID=37001 RepID=A0A1A9WTC0_9MUSC